MAAIYCNGQKCSGVVNMPDSVFDNYYTKEETNELIPTVLPIDEELSDTSENPVQNKAITAVLNEINKTTDFNILAESWETIDNITYPYKTTITDNSITASDFVDIIFSFSSLNIVNNAEIASAGITVDGGIEIYAKTVPVGTIDGIYKIMKGE